MSNPLFSLSYRKIKNTFLWKPLEEQVVNTTDDLDYEYHPFDLVAVQNYNPIYPLFFDINNTNANRISFNHRYYIQDLLHVKELENNTIFEKPVFIKFSPLLDPLRYMTGKYGPSLDNIELPQYIPLDTHHVSAIDEITSTEKKEMIEKLNDVQNASYVDHFFSFLSSVLLNQHGFLHGIDFYGSFLAIQQQFKFNITDDVEYLHSSPFFRDNQKVLFSAPIENWGEFLNQNSRKNKTKLIFGNDIPIMDIVEELSTENIDIKMEEEGEPLESIYEKEAIHHEDDGSDDTSSNSEMNYTTDDNEEEDKEEDKEEDEKENEWETDDEEEDVETNSEQDEIYAYIKHFPVQMICLEKCSGTLDELLEKQRIDCFECVACMFQLIMTLLTYQKAFSFTHNDLHTNNIMYIHTDLPFLYYRYQSQIYKVPTFGKIYKIIDFGRGVYSYRGRRFFSDSFASGGDAATQYNTEPYFQEKKPRIEPNYSFDLCRLGTSIYDFIIEDEMIHEEDLDEFQKTILRWCLDDNGKNVLYKRNGEERYPNFKLYKMIARTVHHHTPEAQLAFPLFAQFRVDDFVNNEAVIMDIDSIPNYA
jgi:hypothetical protein